MQRRRFIASTLAASAALPFATVRAQTAPLPTTPVRIVVGFPPGGGTDVMARVMAQKLATLWGVPVTVENKAGAGGVIDRVVLVDEDGTQRTFEVATLLIHYQSRNLKGLNSEVTEPTTAHVSVAMRLAEDVSEAAKMRGYARRLYLSAIEREGARLHPDNEVLHLALE